jgi:leucyl-tRNA synthetase
MADRHLITSALPYVSGVKHLGNLAGSLLPADVHARFLRQAGKEVLFICATDEHGTPAELAAREAGLSVAWQDRFDGSRVGRLHHCPGSLDALTCRMQPLRLSLDYLGPKRRKPCASPL